VERIENTKIANNMPEKYSRDEWWANRAKFEEWLKEHPVVIPPEILAHILDLQKKADEATTLEEWQEALENIRSNTGDYQLLYLLRNNPSQAKGKLNKLEEKLSDCYCNSGKKFIECHGA
jgi:FMN phosphatase YigB (HAD superfamily)